MLTAILYIVYMYIIMYYMEIRGFRVHIFGATVRFVYIYIYITLCAPGGVVVFQVRPPLYSKTDWRIVDDANIHRQIIVPHRL